MSWRVESRSLGPRDRRALRVGTLIMLPLLAITLVVRPWTTRFIRYREALDRARSLLARERRVLDDAAHDRQRLTALHLALDESSNQLFAGADPATASAELARYVASRALASGVKLERTETETALNEATSADAVPIGARTALTDSSQSTLRVAIRGSGDIRAIVTMLRAVESGPRLVRVEQIAISREAVDGEIAGRSLAITATFAALARGQTRADSVGRPIQAAGVSDTRDEPSTITRPVAAVALARDPFRMRGDLGSDAAVAVPPQPIAPAVRLLGTVIRAGGGFAVCQLSTESPRIVHIGERLGELTLESLEQGRAVFRSANGTRLTLSLATPGA